MTTPIFDFVKKYAEGKTARFHMPGHKGVGPLGCEAYDITEISGADVLYSADGIIRESENNLSEIYGTAHSFYSTEGSTLAIKAMLAIVSQGAEGRSVILAARNAHAAFIRAAALLDLDVKWIYPADQSHLCDGRVTPEDIRRSLDAMDVKPSAVYITSPDYLGNMSDIKAITECLKEYDIPLVVDNAHGAYLKFLPEDMHPISLGAAMCADSAHKTLPVLTGGAYLHVSRSFSHFADEARGALSLFASTSPSYLTLASLDLCNAHLASDYSGRIAALAKRAEQIKAKIFEMGLTVCGGEPLKITVKAGTDLSNHLRERGIEVEFSDLDYTVLMLTPENTEKDFERLLDAIADFKPCVKSNENAYIPTPHEAQMTIRKAVFAKNELINAENAVGRICAAPTVSCPPAVPIVISGERITEDDVRLFKHYGIETVSVVK